MVEERSRVTALPCFGGWIQHAMHPLQENRGDAVSGPSAAPEPCRALLAQHADEPRIQLGGIAGQFVQGGDHADHGQVERIACDLREAAAAQADRQLRGPPGCVGHVQRREPGLGDAGDVLVAELLQ